MRTITTRFLIKWVICCDHHLEILSRGWRKILNTTAQRVVTWIYRKIRRTTRNRRVAVKHYNFDCYGRNWSDHTFRFQRTWFTLVMNVVEEKWLKLRCSSFEQCHDIKWLHIFRLAEIGNRKWWMRSGRLYSLVRITTRLFSRDKCRLL